MGSGRSRVFSVHIEGLWKYITDLVFVPEVYLLSCTYTYYSGNKLLVKHISGLFRVKGTDDMLIHNLLWKYTSDLVKTK